MPDLEIMLALPWLEDFNDPPPQAALPPPEAAPPEPEQAEPTPDPRLEGWQEGYLAGHRQAMLQAAQANPPLTEELCRRITDLEGQLEAIAAQSSAQMGELLIDMLAHVVPDDWEEPVRAKLAAVIAAVKPSFWLAPRLRLHLDPPVDVALRDLPALARLLDEAHATDLAVTLRWDTGETPQAALREALG